MKSLPRVRVLDDQDILTSPAEPMRVATCSDTFTYVLRGGMCLSSLSLSPSRLFGYMRCDEKKKGKRCLCLVFC